MASENTNQKSTDSLREAEEQYAMAKELAGKALSEAKGTITYGVGAAAAYAAAKSVDVKDKASEAAKVAAEYTGEVARMAKDKAVIAGRSAAEYVSEKRKGMATESVNEIEVVDDGYEGLDKAGQDGVVEEEEEEEPEVLTVVQSPVSIRVLLEAVGEVVISIVNTAIDLVIGSQASTEDQRD